MSDFAEDIIEELLDRLAGGEPLARICADKRMPSTSTVYRWLESDEDFAGRFRARKAVGVHGIIDECLEIADGKADDAVEVQNKRVRIDTRLRLAGKWLPAIYGDKLDLTSGGDKIGLAVELEAARRRINSQRGE